MIPMNKQAAEVIAIGCRHNPKYLCCASIKGKSGDCKTPQHTWTMLPDRGGSSIVYAIG